MKQALVIFRKDVKHLWPYAAVMVALLVLHGWIDLQMHRGYLRVVNTYMFTMELEPLLVFLAWWCLAGLAMQQERLPGDRQYWLTRPISRKSLLAAKALFLVTFICLPNFLAQAIVLGVTGFSPIAWLGFLSWNQVLLTVYFLEAAALAAVTANFRQYILTSVAIFAIALFELSSNNGNQWGGVQWVGEAAMQLVLLAGGIAILALQYSRRRTVLARVVLAAGVIAQLLLLTPAGWHPAFAFTSAVATRETASPVSIAFDTAVKPDVLSATEQAEFTPTFYRVAFPVRITGIPLGRELISERVSAVVEAPGVPKWDSGWSSMNQVAPRGEFSSADEWLTHDGTYWLSFNMPGDYYRNVKDKPANFRLVVALTMVTSPAITDLPPDPQMYPVSGAGHCSVDVVKRRTMFSCVIPFERTVAVDFHVQPPYGGATWRADGCCIQSYSPFPTVGKFSVWADTGLMPTGPQFLAAGARISVEVRRPVSFFQREISIMGLKLGLYGPTLETGR